MPGNMDASPKLVWIDLEMTGLDPDSDRIIEIATLITDSDLEVLAEGPVIAIHQPPAVLQAMDEWNRTTHGGSGLLAERATLDFLAPQVKAGASPMCGNSICQDRRFLARRMPQLERFFHYRNLDVSTLKELARRWAPGVERGFTKKSAHLALEDIRESVAELRHYREQLFAEAWRRT
jgi:oligoribonuclease